MQLKVNETADFETYNGLIFEGVVLKVYNHSYLVWCIGEICGSYPDGLFRFLDKNVVRKHNGNSKNSRYYSAPILHN